MTSIRHFNHLAMGTLFEALLVGEDTEHLSAVATALWEEVDRVERLLSRFNVASELNRINRTAAHEPVLIDHELFGVLQTCDQYWRQTGGYFDVTLGQSSERLRANENSAPFVLDGLQRTIRFAAESATLDLGGFGKGYVLDRLRSILAHNQIHSALIHGGMSSNLAVGVAPDRSPWLVGVHNPFVVSEETSASVREAEIAQLSLTDCGLSCSEALAARGQSSDIIDPHARTPLDQQASCVIIAPTALESEILSTALLAMGKARAIDYIGKHGHDRLHVAWIEDETAPTLIWLTAPL